MNSSTIAGQAVFVVALAVVFREAFLNLEFGVEQQGVDLSFDFLERRAGVAYREVLANFGLRAGDRRAAMRLEAGCPLGDGRGGCVGGFGPGAEVRVVVTYRVPVARLPFVGAVAAPSVTVGATQHSRVDRFRGLVG